VPEIVAAPVGAVQPIRGSGGFVTGFGEGEPLVTEVGDDFEPAAECLDVGGECAQFGGSWRRACSVTAGHF
jgi:hypothetical protein